MGYEFNMHSHLRRVCALKNKLVNLVKMFGRFHKMSRGSAPLLGPTMPRLSSSSMMRVASV